MGVNYIADPGNLFHDFYDELTDAIIAGEEVQILSNNSDEREISKQLIEKMPQEMDCLVFGPSLALTIGQEMTGEESFYNLAMSSTDYYDLLAMIALLNLNDKKVDRMIICFDSRLFDDAVSESDGRHDKLMDYSLWMEEVLNNPNSSAEPESTAARYLADYSMMYGADQEEITAETVVELIHRWFRKWMRQVLWKFPKARKRIMVLLLITLWESCGLLTKAPTI
ncbi:MAG: hypothetical protein IJ379_12130 [Lachnospiraceae bacterium]|nr:hypothetical protein [Lachnospiraceae bacterium]